ncbi:DUF1566 domain-containing protein [Pseudomonas sp. 18175]|uniref:DUF1566 domain-containing protein n=1 Tax=Pseudomonas sp. 18175 TaxID=3390056 RepID=UPI003D20619E
MSTVESAIPADAIPAIGQPYGGGFVTGITRDTPTGQLYLNITAGGQYELRGAWGKPGKLIEGADSFTDSRANTGAMAAAGSELARQTLNLNIGGFNDWAIPARDVQELQYRHFKPGFYTNHVGACSGVNPSSVPVGMPYSEEEPPQTAHPGFRPGEPEAFHGLWWMTSTQYSADYCHAINFEEGFQTGIGKGGDLPARPVRRIPIAFDYPQLPGTAQD